MEEGQGQAWFLPLLFACLSIGIVFADRFVIPSYTLIFCVLLSFGVAIFLVCRRARFAFLAMFALFFLLGLFRMEVAERLPAHGISHFVGENRKVTGILKESVRVQEYSDRISFRYLVEVEKVHVGGEEKRASGDVYFYRSVRGAEDLWQKVERRELPRIGDRITAEGKLRLPHGYRNPGQIDLERKLRAEGITAQLSVGRGGVHIEKTEENSLLRIMEEIRLFYREGMERAMPKEDAAAIYAMLFGGYEGIQEELLESFTITGLVHLLSVSGSHISLLAAVLVWLGTTLRIPRFALAVFVLFSIAFYAALAGFVPPVLRAALMGGAAFLAVCLERERDAAHILILTAIGMLFYEPYLLYHISFQLSFSATAGLIYLSPRIRDFLASYMHPIFAAGLGLTIGVQFMSIPILVYYFQAISLVSLIANMTAAPIAEFVIIIGLFAGVTGVLLLPLMQVLFVLDSLLLGIVYEMTRLLAKIPYAMVQNIGFSYPLSVLYYAGILFFLQKKECRSDVMARLKMIFTEERKYVMAGAVVFLCALLVFWTRPAKMEVHFVDVGQGDAAVVLTPHGHALLFDTGGTQGYDIGARVLAPYLCYHGVRKVEAIFLSHAHLDHAGGAGAILRKFPVGPVFTAGEGRSTYAKVMGFHGEEEALSHLVMAQEGKVFDIDGVRVETIYVPENLPSDGDYGNETSVVYRVCYGAASFLITGDLIAEQEAEILKEGHDVRSVVLKVAHHGSENSTTEEFLTAVSPNFAVISVGAENRFGHPKESVLKRLEGKGLKPYRTDRDGAIIFRTDGREMSIEKYWTRSNEEGAQWGAIFRN